MNDSGPKRQDIDIERTLGDAEAALGDGFELLVAVNESGEYRGLFGDSEWRQAVRSGMPSAAPLSRAVSDPPRLQEDAFDSKSAKEAMEAAEADYAVCIVDGRLRDVMTRRALFANEARPETAILMVGGEGQRLRPLTDSTPKPMLPVAGRPILEHIVRHLAEHGVQKLVMALGYRAEQIEAHFGDGSAFGVEIRYVREEKPLGTAGAVGLVEDLGDRPLLVMNGDILSRLDITAMAAQHHKNRSAVTMAARAYHHPVPYGVLKLVGSRVASLDEKPLATWWTNAGVYLMDPQVVTAIRPNRYLDMTMLIEDLIGAGDRVDAFPVYEYWCDIGLPEDYHRANDHWEGKESD